MRPDSPSHAFLPFDVPTPPMGDGPLAGARLAVKDVFDVAGAVTHAGSPPWGVDQPPAGDTARAVSLLTDAGARVVGKTVPDELAFSLLGNNRHYPRPVNRAAPDRVTGGSSSGSAAAVGWGEAEVAVCTDTGGSIRAPASFCGLMGLRTTHGRVPMEGCVPLAPSFDTGGWFAATPALYRATAMASLPPTHVALAEWPRARSCAVLDGLVERGSAREYARIRSAALDHLGPVEPLDVGSAVDELYWCFRRLQAREAWSMHGPFVTRYGPSMNRDVRARFEWGRAVTAAEHGHAMRLRDAFAAWLADELGSDVLVLPTVPGPAPLAEGDPDEIGGTRERALRLLCVAGLAGLPQLTLPLGSVDGAPFGLSLIGPRNTDVALIDLGTAIMADAGARQCVVSS